MIIKRHRGCTEFRLRALLCICLFIAFSVDILSATNNRERQRSTRAAWRAASQSSKIAPWVFEHTANGEAAEFFVVLADQADLSRAGDLPTKAEKGRYVYDALRNKSEATQTPLLRWLGERGIEHRSFYIVNAIL